MEWLIQEQSLNDYSQKQLKGIFSFENAHFKENFYVIHW